MKCRSCGNRVGKTDTTNNLSGVWGSSPSDVFAVGQHGTILHYDGTTWKSMSRGTTNNLNGLWGSSSAESFAVGNGGTMVYYDGLVSTSERHHG